MPAENPAPDPIAADPIAIELAQLAQAPIAALRARWRDEFRCEPPAAFGPDLLRRSLAYWLQEQTYGKLSAATQRELDRLIAHYEKNPSGRFVAPRRIKTGSVLVRHWKGQSHRVTVFDQGFGYHDKTYTSLSEIARAITGTRWNGPRFFGLRNERQADAQP
jgi:hypothetical protein